MWPSHFSPTFLQCHFSFFPPKLLISFFPTIPHYPSLSVKVCVTGRQGSKRYLLFQVVLQNIYSRPITNLNSTKKMLPYMPELLVTWLAPNSVNNHRNAYVSIPLTQWLAPTILLRTTLPRSVAKLEMETLCSACGTSFKTPYALLVISLRLWFPLMVPNLRLIVLLE